MSRTALLIIILFLLFQTPVWAGWYSAEPPATGHRGWYAYEKYKKTQETKQNSGERPVRQPKIHWPTYEEVLKMKPSDLKKWLQKATEEAVADPSEKNVTRWAIYMKAAREKSVRFAGSLSFVLLKHPELSYAPDFPITYQASRALSRARYLKINSFLQKIRDRFALILLVSSRSPLSEPAQKICRKFADETGWKLVVVDADSRPDIAKRLGAKYVPQAFIISRDPGISPLPVMAGAEALPVLRQNVYTVARIALGEISPAEFGTHSVSGLVPAKQH
ncbi:hypothetical protein Thein_1937 [Thermodesulfatator indicus DSM 15286]|uniref:Conjugal transfer protein TraF n=1 Tax=Thermodesulfatator indicus (strain DSM 15286 / JCM 11887 / CIR29812) TaxID=667014 RepID=F8ACL7_THEID|nr:conjugal transfer protein TraF [Thermodesulfatator indicus]AEH45792.1 hypothetical protein Thein_1937 [Thermodesulfatator indicus DSM 15286]